jgi:hypothetical protein
MIIHNRSLLRRIIKKLHVILFSWIEQVESKKGEVQHCAYVFNFQAFELWILVFEEGKKKWKSEEIFFW